MVTRFDAAVPSPAPLAGQFGAALDGRSRHFRHHP
jgi:hypothetical protein